ncbi:MAG: type II toxin-antitoxin system RelE/ParE family toxin [Meiothermus sp.]|nr:type II toxin-antitoxin system RelE/ParE family toxin [Meiothermus sp.]
MTLVAVWRPSADQDLGVVLAEIPEEYKERFWDVLEQTVQTIQDFPEAFPVVYAEKAVRRVVLKPFPYLLFYVVELNRVAILALIHGRQNPDKIAKRFE